MRRTLCTMAMAGLFVGTAANDGSTNATGIAGPFIPNDQVQMVNQDLRIEIRDEYTNFEVHYLFRNHGYRTTVGMAFPVEGYNFGPPVVERFESWVDGKKVPVTYQELRRDDYDYNFEARYFKRVTFETRKDRRVVVRYRAKNGIDSINMRYISYLLEPGSTWRGTLDQCRIAIDWRHVSDSRNVFAALTAYASESKFSDTLKWQRTTPTQLTLTLRNFEPRGSIAIRLPSGFTRIRVGGQLLDYEMFHHRANPMLDGDEVLVAGFGLMYGGRDRQDSEDRQARKQSIAGLFPGDLTLREDGLTLESSRGSTYTLRRKSILSDAGIGTPDYSFEYVYLRDAVEALGGTYEFDEELMEVSVTIPDPRETSRPGKPISNIDPALSPTGASKDTPSSELIMLAVGFSIALIAGACVPKR